MHEKENMINDNFTLDKKKKVILYGDNQVARNMAGQLSECGYQVTAILDRKYKSISRNERDMFLLSDVESVKEQEWFQTGIFIICVTNGMMHDEIANTLYQAGARCLVFLPMTVRFPLAVQNQYRKCYKQIMCGRYQEAGPVPVYRTDFYEDYVVIEQDMEQVCFWCPIEFLHTCDKESLLKNLPEKLKEKEDKLISYADKRIEDYVPYVNFFQYLNGGQTDIHEYLDLFRSVESEQKLFLEDRKKLFCVYEHAYKYNMEFFTESPALVKWNQHGYFNVIDGMHRIQYLFLKGRGEFPVRTGREEYQKFVSGDR